MHPHKHRCLPQSLLPCRPNPTDNVKALWQELEVSENNLTGSPLNGSNVHVQLLSLTCKLALPPPARHKQHLIPHARSSLTLPLPLQTTPHIRICEAQELKKQYGNVHATFDKLVTTLQAQLERLAFHPPAT